MITPIGKAQGEGKLNLNELNRRKPFRLVSRNPTDRTNPDFEFFAIWIRSIRSRDLPRFAYFKVPTPLRGTAQRRKQLRADPHVR